MPSTKTQTIAHFFLAASNRPADWIALRYKHHRKWLSLTWKDYFRSAEAVGLGLAGLGVQKGDRVALLANTCWEWAAADFGILGLGAVTVPIYQSHRPEEIEFVLQHSGARVLILEDASQLKKWESIARRCRSVEKVICIRPPESLPDSILMWDDLLNHGIEKFSAEPGYFAQQIEKIALDDMATIVYTSGTTGEPKGAVLTHRQIMSEVEDLAIAFPISPGDCSLSFLPYAHVLGRVEMWLNTYVGFTLAFAENIDQLRHNLKEIRPTVMIGVPRIFEKIHGGVLSQFEGKPWRKKFLDLFAKTKVADFIFYSKLREGLGGRLRFAVSGGAPLESEIAQFFNQAGILVLEGYGLTETTAAIAVNTPDHYRFGTVGRPLNDVRIQLAEDGEILIKSDKTMQTYFKNPEATETAFRDGYFCTGDIGVVGEDGYLKITDRKKDLIKTAGGKYVAPQKLEGLLKLNPLISNVLIHGDRRKYIVALVTLDEPHLKSIAREKGWTFRDFKSLTQRPEVIELVRKGVAQVNSALASYETIKNFSILPHDFTIQSGELTPSLKVKRRVCDENYKELIDRLY